MNAYYDYSNIPQENTNVIYQPAPQKQGKKSGGKIAALALCFSLLGGAIGTGGTYLAMSNSDKPTSVVASQSDSESKSEKDTVLLANSKPAQTVTDTAASKSTKLTAAEVYKANVNSTVGITTSINTNYLGYKTTAAASGSGFIISKDGYIVTNHHVIEDANKITVSLYNGKKYEAELIGSDESSDVAVLKIDANDLTPVTLGSSAALNVGDEVAAIGNPLGELTFSLTTGVVSALDRSVTTENSTMTLIQTDAAINSGNSGGALFNMYGEVIGITNAKYSSSGTTGASIDNIGFAIPINSAKAIINSLINNGYVVKPYIGIAATDVGDEQDGGSISEGAVIKKIYDNSPAESSGLKVDDIITEVNGKAIKSSGELTSIVKGSSKGDKLVCKVYRDGSYTEVTITVGETSQEQEQPETEKTEKNESSRKQGSSGSVDPFGDDDDYDYFGSFPRYR